MNNYQILGVDYHADERTLKRAYAKLIKEFRPDSHATEFARIRAAYEALLDDIRYRQVWYEDDEQDLPDTTLNSDEDKVVAPISEEQDYERLVDKPVLPISEDTANTEEEIYERLVDKPVLVLPETIDSTPPKDENFNRLIDKPVLRDVLIEPVIDEELAWTKRPDIDVYALIRDLQTFVMPKDEHAALACFQQQLNSLSNMNLDQLMDYEERLYHYLIHHDQPALLLFAAASQYFNWQDKVRWLKSAQSQWQQQRFLALTELAAQYQQVSKTYHPYFQAERLTPKRLSTHYHHELKQQQREQWFIICHAAKLTKLHDYFSEKALHQTIYVADIVLGGIIGAFFTLIGFDELTTQYAQSSLLLASWLPSLVLCSSTLIGAVLSAVALAFWRSLALNITKGMAWVSGCGWLILSAFLPKGVGMLVLGLLIFWILFYFLYSALVKLEYFLAKTLTAIFNWFRSKERLNTRTYFTQTDTMNKSLYALLLAQFLSAFADNAILFTVIAMVMKTGEPQGWYIPALQSAFLVAYIVLAPWVGHVADVYAKSKVLLIANVIKALGAALLLFHIEPLFAYGIVGVGAAIYSPAKYGILPELVGHHDLVKANSWIEGSTIMAILLGMKIGAMVADESVIVALMMVLSLFIISAVTTLILPVNVSRKDKDENLLVMFGKQMSLFFTTPRSRFAVLGGSLFWAAAASLRVMLIAWAALVLSSHSANEIADLTLYLTIGIIAGSIAVPRLIPLEHLRRARIPAYLMAVAIMALSFTGDVLSAQIVLFFIGMMGGMFVVPINAVLQEHGQHTIGSGSAVALQNFFQNLAMLLAVGAYSIAAGQQINAILTMLSLGVLVFVATLLVSLNLPKD